MNLTFPTNPPLSPSDIKLGELIILISQKSADDRSFGAVKLNKLLFYSDALAFAKWGESITGAEYWNQKEGPVPKRFVQVRSQLFAEDPPALAIQYIDIPGLPNPQQKPVALRSPRIGDVRGDQLLLVEDVIKQYWNYTGTDLSNKSHKEWAWKLTSREDTIDLSTVFLSPLKQPSEQDLRRALDLLERDTELLQQLKTLVA
jgi:uncharacterized phage-associated protein